VPQRLLDDMTVDYQKLTFDYRRSIDQGRDAPAHHAVVIVGAGPVGLTCAIDLACQGIKVLVLDDDDTLSSGSRAICFAKRTLEIWDRLGCGDRMVDKGVSWNVGKVYFQDELVYRFDLLDEPGHHRPAFINLQQYYVEGFLFEKAATEPNIELRWNNRVVGVTQDASRATVKVDTPDDEYAITCDYLIACDGSRSPVRGMLGLKSDGHSFRDRFLIADVKMTPETSARFAAERWFWFDPPFHRGQSVLLHRQPDDVWRIDFQLGWDADPVAEREPARVAERVKALLAHDADAEAEFTFEWMSVYTFACLRMERFRHGRVLFAGDAAHGVSPFGARGANSGVQDADNIAWKLRLVLQGHAPDRLLDSYDSERVDAADENILNSTRSTDFITPKSAISRTFRDAVLKLASDHPFARRLVNSGRLSLPATLASSTLNTSDVDAFAGAMMPGAACIDAPIAVDTEPGWLLHHLRADFTLMCFASDDEQRDDCIERIAKCQSSGRQSSTAPLRGLVVMSSEPQRATRAAVAEVVHDREGRVAQRYDATPGSAYLIRPDQHVCARWRNWGPAEVLAALLRATCND
jgi:3-(3-hydroxy-phenyl)propionate hydroxylase